MSLNKDQLTRKVIEVATKLLSEKGYVSPVDVFLETGRLSQENYEAWRSGKVPFLEKVITGGLGKINTVLRTLHSDALNKKLKPSKTDYKSWGKGTKFTLRFSKTGDRNLEEAYSTHYVLTSESLFDRKPAQSKISQPLPAQGNKDGSRSDQYGRT